MDIGEARVAAISFTTYSKHLNYGAVLHGWAFQRVLESMGCPSATIDYVARGLEGYSIRWPFLNARHRRFIPALRFLARWSFSLFANLRKERKFRRFLRENLRLTDRTYRERDLVAGDPELDRFDVFVCESDVTWKKRDTADFDRGFLLDFPAARAKARVAYAPSLGSRPYPSDQEPRFVEAVRGFAAIGTRERAGAEYVGRLLGRDIPWVLDPTLLLAATEYAAIAKRPRFGGYVLLYTCMKYNRNMVEEARRYADRLGRRLVEVGNYGVNRYLHGHSVIDDAGVEEWLGLFSHADAVVCNSFHGICFSIIFRKPFYVFSRGGDDFRFANICAATGLADRLLAPDGRIPAVDAAVDFDAVEAALAPVRARSEAFLREHVIGSAKARKEESR